MIKNYLSILLGLVLSSTALAQLKLPEILSDNMVLQQETQAPLWGWANPGSTITVKTNWDEKASVETQADSQGRWQVKLKTPEAGQAYELTIQSSGEQVTIKNILVGEVWVCSGQSNMEMPVEGWFNQPIDNSEETIKNAANNQIRLFTVTKKTALSPQEDVTGSWEIASPETVAKFSATAYFFGKELNKVLEVPVGLIHSSWGGTVAEAWTSEKALRELGDFNKDLDRIDSIRPVLKEVIVADKLKSTIWEKSVNQINESYAAANFDDSYWKNIETPKIWEDAGYPNLDGIAWYRKIINIPAEWAGKDLVLELGPIDDLDITWFNGVEVGKSKEEGFYWAAERTYTIPGNLVKAGKNAISIRVLDTGGNGGLYGSPEQVKLSLKEGADQNTISLAGNWKFLVEKRAPRPAYSENANTPTVLYNAMIAPLVPYSIRGAIWYQGESNVGRAEQYERLFPQMIRNWRADWDQGDFPFYFAQIAPFGYPGDGTASAQLRDAQRKSQKLDNTGMAVLLDIGSLATIHPSNKGEVGHRLALLALDKTYDKSRTSSGPTVNKIKVKDNNLELHFENLDGGLVTSGELTAFEIAGADRKFVKAQAKLDGDTIILTAEGVNNPVYVRYAFTDKAEAQLFNKAGLPASSFELSK